LIYTKQEDKILNEEDKKALEDLAIQVRDFVLHRMKVIDLTSD
jgi:hypothetical protein